MYKTGFARKKDGKWRGGAMDHAGVEPGQADGHNSEAPSCPSASRAPPQEARAGKIPLPSLSAESSRYLEGNAHNIVPLLPDRAEAGLVKP